MNTGVSKKRFRSLAFVYLIACIFVGGLLLMRENVTPFKQIVGVLFMLYLGWKSFNFYRAANKKDDE